MIHKTIQRLQYDTRYDTFFKKENHKTKQDSQQGKCVNKTYLTRYCHSLLTLNYVQGLFIAMTDKMSL